MNINELATIINDEYAEFRKALAEGKIIQYRNLKVNAFKNWQDLGNLKFNPNFEHRIKPEEPKFKVGDWVRDKKRKHKPFMVTSSDLEADSPNYVKIDCELWQPQPGELVILKDKNSIISIIKYNGETNVYPFIGEITWLHRKD